MAAGKALAKWVLPLPSVWRLSFAGQTIIRCKARSHLTLLIFLSVFQFVLDFGYTLGFKALFPCFLLCKIWLGIHWNKWEKLCAPRWMERTACSFMVFNVTHYYPQNDWSIEIDAVECCEEDAVTGLVVMPCHIVWQLPFLGTWTAKKPPGWLS